MSLSAERVVVDRPEQMNLLGLLMQGLLARNLASPTRYGLAKRLAGDIQVKAGKMTATLRLKSGRIVILAGPSPKPKAWVAGTMSGMLGLITATDPIRPLASRAVTFGGNPFFLVALLPLVIPDTAIKQAWRSLIPNPLRPGRS